MGRQYYGNDWEKRERRRQADEKRHETVARNRAMREGEIDFDDHSDRFSTVVYGCGGQAVCHCGSDGEFCPDDEVRDPNNLESVSSERTFCNIIVPDELCADSAEDELEPDDTYQFI